MGVKLKKYSTEKPFNKSSQVGRYLDEEDIRRSFANGSVYIPQKKGESYPAWTARRRTIQKMGEEFRNRFGDYPGIVFSEGIPSGGEHLEFGMMVTDGSNSITTADVGMLEEDEPGAWDCLDEDERY